MHQPGTNIRTLRLQLGLNQQKLAISTGLDQGTISNIERGATGYTQDSLERIAKALNVSVGELFVDGETLDAAAIGVRRVPVLKAADVAAWRGLENTEFDWDTQEFLFTGLKTASRFAFALRIDDVKNAPLLEPGDVVLFEMKLQPRPGDMVAAVDAGGGMYLGRFRALAPVQAEEPAFEIVPADGWNPPSRHDDFGGLTLKGVLVEQRRYRRK
jgi:transcriptional regulator with XRE-family HTH domain